MRKDASQIIELRTIDDLNQRVFAQIATLLVNPAVSKLLIRVEDHTVSLTTEGIRQVRNNGGKTNTSLRPRLNDQLEIPLQDLHAVLKDVKELKFDRLTKILTQDLLFSRQQTIELITFLCAKVNNTSSDSIDLDEKLETILQSTLSQTQDYLSQHPEELVIFLQRLLKQNEWNILKKYINLEKREQDIKIQTLQKILQTMTPQEVITSLSWRLTKQEFIEFLIQYETKAGHQTAGHAELYDLLTRKSLIEQFLHFEKALTKNNYQDFARNLFLYLDPITFSLVTEFMKDDFEYQIT